MRGFNETGLIFSEGYAETMAGEALPYIGARRTDMRVSGKDGRALFVSRFDADAPRGTVLIVHGFTENVEKFSELIHSLLINGMSVVAYDQRGHGRSWRAPGLKDVSLTHVDRFDDYVEDLRRVYADAVAPMPRPHRIFCHSMGGAVTALFLEDPRGAAIERAAMCAPMIAPDLKGLPTPVGRLLCGGAGALGMGKRRVFISRPYVYPDDFDTAPANGRARFDWYETVRRDHPEFQNNGPTYGWTLESIDVTRRILAPGAPERIEARIQLYTAALDDTVLPGPQKAFIDRVPRGEHFTVRDAKHEVFRSTDAVLFPWWAGVLRFLTEAETGAF